MAFQELYRVFNMPVLGGQLKGVFWNLISFRLCGFLGVSGLGFRGSGFFFPDF